MPGTQFEASFDGLAELTRKFETLPAKLDQAERNTVRRASLEALREFKQNLSPPTLRRRSGHLADSANAAEPIKGPLGWSAAVGYRKGDIDSYARVQEGVDKAGNYVDSTTIRAKKRLLAIPIDEALTAAGLPRYSGPREFGQGVNQLGGPGFWMKFNASLFFVVPSGKGKNARLHFLFLGVPQVTIRGKRPLRSAAEGVQGRMRAIAEEEIGAVRRSLGA